MAATINEKILFFRIKQRDKEAFMRAYDLYSDSIYRFIYFKLNNREEAQDLTSAVFLKAWDYIQNNSVQSEKTLRALFYKIARNTVIDYYRKKNKESQISIEALSQAAEIPPGAVMSSDPQRDTAIKIDNELLEKQLANLKDEYREILLLRFLDDLAISEIAVILEKSRGNVRVLVYRALNALKELMEKENK
jgi:RNA polymerase sigma-70 factor (ECF subfamily)